MCCITILFFPIPPPVTGQAASIQVKKHLFQTKSALQEPHFYYHLQNKATPWRKCRLTTVTLHSHRQHYHLQGFILLCWNVGWLSPDVLSFLCTNGSLFTAGRPRAPVPMPVRLPVVRPPTGKYTRYTISAAPFILCVYHLHHLFPISYLSHRASELSSVKHFYLSSSSSLSQPKTMLLKSVKNTQPLDSDMFNLLQSQYLKVLWSKNKDV